MRPFLLSLGWLVLAAPAAAEFSGNLAVEALAFTNTAQFAQQMDNNLTLSFKPKWDGDWSDGDDLWSAEFYLRADNKDAERQHADVRELMWLHLDGDNEWRVGINTMFWGVTESQHLVDVVNQVDGVEGLDGEEKLGQPMIHLKRYQDWGVIDFLILPGFRQRTFAGAEGRLRPALVVDVDQVTYQSSSEDQHIDFALRFMQTYGDLDLGLHLFDGTNREPVLSSGVDSNSDPVLTPFYEQMTQVGVDAQLIVEDWIWRLEYIHRNSDSSRFNAFTAGFEYTFYGIFDSAVDFGSLLEYSYDDRAAGSRGILDRDLFLGGRFAFNDIQSSEILAGIVVDTSNQSRSFRVEGSRRFGDSWKGTLELQTFNNIDPTDPLAALQTDDHLLLEFAYFF